MRARGGECARLRGLEIEDFTLIERASVRFSDGLTVFSGETGSGKTMLIGALDFVLGERSSPDAVRGGAPRARVTLEIEPDAALRKRLDDDGFPSDDDEPVIAMREMTASGKSSARINGALATSAQLRALGSSLLESIGQHEAQRLLTAAFARDALDAFAGDDALAARAAAASAHGRASELARTLAELRENAGRAEAELAFARFALGEIDAAAVTPGEDERLRERRTLLAEADRIGAALAAAHAALEGDEGDAGGAAGALGAAAAALAGVERFGAGLAALGERLSALQSDAQEAAVAVARELETLDTDPAELEATSARLDELEALRRKYGGTLEAVLESRERFAAALDGGVTRDEREAALVAEGNAARAELARHAATLSRLRAAAAADFEERIAHELRGLAMPAARFAVQLEPLAEAGPAGAESVAFALSPNPGEPLRPLARAASGGELSRVLLALVVATAEGSAPRALVFDEIDAGIGGATAGAVGSRLASLARATQVVCVTHLAQIAAWADRQYVLRKRERNGATTVELVPLDEAGDVASELARMLSGTPAPVALEHARALLRETAEARTKR